MIRVIPLLLSALLAAPSVLAVPAALEAQTSEGRVARMAVLRPKEDMQAEFEAGYRRHLEWHRAQDDPWAWYGWQILTGDRIGWFVDGTFGHAWADLDRAVAPAEDAADNAENVAPYADFATHAVYRLRPELSSTRRTPPFVELITVEVVPGRERAFERLARRIHRALDASRSSEHAVYELVNGSSARHYLIMLPRERLADLEWSPRGFAGLLQSAPGTADDGDGAVGLPANSSIRAIRSELLRYRPDLSYIPAEPR